MLRTRITDLLGIKYPVIQGGMARIAEDGLASAVSNAGGLGLIAGGNAPPETIREQIRRARKLTDKPFGLNIMLMSPNADDLAKLVVEENVPIVTTGAGSPGKYIEAWKKAGIKVLPVVPAVVLAKRMEQMGVDAVIAEGTESGGHIGEQATMSLIPQVVDSVKIPVIAAGGIGDGRGLAAALMLGAEGVQCGTCFLVADECIVHENFKQKVLGAKDTDTVVTGRSHGHPARSFKNAMTRKYVQMEEAGATFEELEEMTIGSLKRAVEDGDIKDGSFMAGQSAGLIYKKATAKEIIEEMVSTSESIVKTRISLWENK